MSSVSAEAVFNDENKLGSVDSGDIAIDGLDSIVGLHLQAQEVVAATDDLPEEETYRAQIDSIPRSLNEGTYNRHSVEQEKRLLVRARMGDVEARDELIEANKWVVLYLARRFEAPGADYDELVQEGSIALWKAIKWKDIDSAMRFSTYAYKGVHWAMLHIVEKSQSISMMTEEGFDDSDLSNLVVDQSASDAFTRALYRRDIGSLAANLSDLERKALVSRFVLDRKLVEVGREISPEGGSQNRTALETLALRAIERALKKLGKEISLTSIPE